MENGFLIDDDYEFGYFNENNKFVTETHFVGECTNDSELDREEEDYFKKPHLGMWD